MTLWHLLMRPQVQTIKTAIEAACLLLRIDDIVSGITKKQRVPAGPSMQGPQTEDADGVIPFPPGRAAHPS